MVKCAGTPDITFRKLSGTLVVGRALIEPVQITAPGTSTIEQFLVAAGGAGTILGASGLQSSEIIDANTLTAKAGPKLVAPRALHSTTRLKDGRVLLAGGFDAKGNPVKTAEIYDPKTNKFTATGSMATARAAHGAALLPNGKVLVAGGMKVLIDFSSISRIIATLPSAPTRSAEIFDPATGRWSAAASLSKSLIAPGLVTLGNGLVMATGGVEVSTFFGVPNRIRTTTTFQLYNPGTNRWSSSNMPTSVAAHELSSLLLKDGRYLVTGGVSFSINLIPPPSTINIPASNLAMIYDPKANRWTRLPNMTAARFGHMPFQAPNGDVYAVGGGSGSLLAPTTLATSDRLTLSTLKWSAGPSLPSSLLGYGVLTTSNGDIVLVGGGGTTTGAGKEMFVFFP